MKSQLRPLILLFLALPLLFASCSRSLGREKSAEFFDSEAPSTLEEQTMAVEQSADEAYSGDLRSGKLSFNTLADAEWDNSGPGKKGQQDQNSVQQEEKPKRIYSGSAGLLVDDTEKTKSAIESLATGSGGYVESVYDTSIVIRVPAAEFNRIFKAVLELGKVESQSVETADITEIYSDLSGRLGIAVTSRNRLYELLRRTEDTNEQVQILKEIGRLTEEIENIRLILQNLDNYISYSRISVNLTPRLTLSASDLGQIPFPWLRTIEPLSPAGKRLRARIHLKPGDEFAVFSGKRVYRAESWSGTRIFISTVPNRPRGDSRFWQEALEFHLSPFYSKAERREDHFGDRELLGVLFTSKDRNPFVLYIGVIADGGKLHVVQIFSPTEDAALLDGVFAALEKGSLK